MGRSVIPHLNQLEYDIENAVSDRSRLAHVNMLSLLGDLNHSHTDPNNNTNDLFAFAAINERRRERLDSSLRDEILKFIAGNSNKKSICLCRGHLENQQIRGDSHWTTLHLRKETVNGKIIIRSYHVDSLDPQGQHIPEAVTRILNDIPNLAIRNISQDLRSNRLFTKAINLIDTQQIEIKRCEALPCRRQTDGYSCGYHSAFNAARTFEATDDQLRSKNLTPTIRSGQNVQDFITEKTESLKREFPYPSKSSFNLSKKDLSWIENLASQFIDPSTDIQKLGIPLETTAFQYLILEIIEKKISDFEKIMALDFLYQFTISTIDGDDDRDLTTLLANAGLIYAGALPKVMKDYALDLLSQYPQEPLIKIISEELCKNAVITNLTEFKQELEEFEQHKNREALVALIRKIETLTKQRLLDSEDNPLKDNPRQTTEEPIVLARQAISQPYTSPSVSPQTRQAVRASANTNPILNIALSTKTETEGEIDQLQFDINIALLETFQAKKLSAQQFLQPQSYCGLGIKTSYIYNRDNNRFEFTITEIFNNSKAQNIGLNKGDIISLNSANNGQDLDKVATNIRSLGLFDLLPEPYKLGFARPSAGLTKQEEAQWVEQLTKQKPNFIHNNEVLDYRAFRQQIACEQPLALGQAR